MANRIVGQPATITLPTTNEIEFDLGDYDPTIFAEAGMRHIYNKTLDTSVAIVSNDGVQGSGKFKFTLGAGHGFSPADRCTPQAGNTTLDSSTPAAAQAASAVDGSERLLLWFVDVHGTAAWCLGLKEINVGVRVSGLLPSRGSQLFGTDGIR